MIWAATLGSVLYSLAGVLLQTPLDAGLLLLHVLLPGAWALVCARFLERAPDHVTGAYLTGTLVILSLFARATADAWALYGLGGAVYGVIGAPIIIGQVLVWGWAGVLIALSSTLVLTLLAVEAAVPQGLTVAFALLTMTVGAIRLYFYVNELETRQRRLERNASTDLLTGTGNRRALIEDFGRYKNLAQRQGVQFLLMSWDVDGLKRVNDKAGHAAGDQYILGFVNALRDAVRHGDSIYRVGGDEFITLHIGLTGGAALYDRVRDTFQNVSAGWTRATNLTLDQALTEADEMMYAEKRRHKEKVTRILGDTAASRG
jgi:diguanylate cyclase (GGDEF)-like protein